MLLTIALATLTFLSLALTLWQFVVARRFPLHLRSRAPSQPPGVTLLKPLKGCDAETAECLRSWLAQDYGGPLQILFGVTAADDPVCEVVRRLMASHPQADAHLMVCTEQLGPNAKVSKLIQLARHARHEVIAVSDADVWAPSDFLAQAVGPLHETTVGLVCSFYELAKPANLPMRWESFAVNADFWSQVLQSRSLKPVDFALGAVMATTRTHLDQIGGFAALVDHLADDYQLGHQIARNGARIALCPVVVECRSEPMSWREVWRHQLRWARTIRVCQPGPYFLSILSNATLWPLAWWVTQPSWRAGIAAAVCLFARMATAFFNERKLTRRADLHSLWLAPAKDLLQVGIWALAFLGRNVTWRGERFLVLTGGKLVKAKP